MPDAAPKSFVPDAPPKSFVPEAPPRPFEPPRGRPVEPAQPRVNPGEMPTRPINGPISPAKTPVSVNPSELGALAGNAAAGRRVIPIKVDPSFKMPGGPTGCFVAGTLVWTRLGKMPIEEIQIGDFVLAQPERRGELEYRIVKDTFVFEDKEIYRVTFADEHGRQEEVLATPNHPFFVADEGWTGAEYLKPGQLLELHDRSNVTVVAVEDTGLKQRVFNFEVGQFHTYYVGESGVWVHNVDCGKVAAEIQSLRDIAAKAKAPSPAAAARKNHLESIKDFGKTVADKVADAAANGAEQVRKISDRLAYVGSTPSKYSRTGREVVERMRTEGKIRGDGPLKKGNPNNLEVLGPDDIWYKIDHTIDMAHTIDAVSWWNKTGRFFGAKTKEVREFMLDSTHYRLEPQSINRSQGAKLKENYLPPEPKNFKNLE